jgi:elongation factor P hydroxylase
MMAAASATLQRVPAKPFYFNTSAHLLRITKYKASTLSELLDALRECPEDSIFQHTFRTLQEHHFLRAGFSNDFAYWALPACNKPGLSDAFASVDVREFTSVAELRVRFIQILEKYLRENPESSAHMADEPFYFCASDIVVMPTSFQAHTLRELTEGIRSVSVHSIHHHFIEARLRIKLMSNDFSQWLQQDAGLTEIAHSLNRIDIYTTTLEDVRQQIVRILERALT